MNTKRFPYWLAVEESKLVKFSDLAHMMATALHPSKTEEFAYGCARVNLDKELPDAVHNGDLIVRNASGMGQHQFPHGNALQNSVILPHELRPFLEARGIELRLMPHGSGPTLWNIENAAIAISEQEGWHDHAREQLLDRMMEAAAKRELIIRDPHTDLPKSTGDIREYYELLTPADVNAWLNTNSASYRWNVTMPVASTDGDEQKAQTRQDSEDHRNDPAYKAEYDRHWHLLEEQSKLQCEERQNLPYINVEIKKRLSQIRYELRTPEPDGAPITTPQPAPAKGSNVHRIKSRRHTLDPIIAMAKKAALEPDNYLSVWPALVALARLTDRPKPLTGYAENEGVLYETEKDPCKPFTKEALRKKMDPGAR